MKRSIHLLLLFFAFTACDYTDIEPKGIVKTNNAQALINLLRYDYHFLAMDLPVYMTDDMRSEMPRLDNQFYESIYNFDDYFVAETETYGQLDHLCAELNATNIALQNEEIIGTPSDILKVKATAHLMRAHVFFTLANTFCPQYTEAVKDQPNTGWPILLKEDYTANLQRSTLGELYQQIISDIEASMEYNLDFEASIYGNNLSAKALLATVYFQMGNYSEALPYINEVLDEYSELRDYRAIDGLPYEVEEKKLNNVEIIWYRGSAFKSSASKYNPQSNHAILSDDLLALFSDDNDLRKGHLFESNGLTRYFAIRTVSGDASVTVPSLLLMKAECLARANEPAEAAATLNVLREKRFAEGTAYELSASTQEQALDLIYKEYRLEYPFTLHRFYQIRRLNALHNANISISRKNIITGEDISLPANDPKWTLAIPQKHIGLNPEIVQNPRE